ncbi:helicase-related protein [Rhodoluna sp.]|uniref:helicase-related protein n=1 Tax=Rhodoluna sp. TaxID=1969481 RepID=UPI0025F3B36B|nr:helicase-related protein [Rhodoluna sp.]
MGARIIDNKRVQLATVLNEIAPKHKHLSIATGYWDLPGLQELFESISNYESIRLLIGQEPLPPQYASNLDLQALDETFPEFQMVENLKSLEHSNELRALVVALKKLIEAGKFEVKIYRGDFMHAKTYIFGDLNSKEAVGIIGSSNFTKAGLTRNVELNALEDDARIVKSQPHIQTDEHGHLSWFEELWTSPSSEEWDGKFTEILEQSPVGDQLFSPYLMYIKALYEIYSDELVPDTEVSKNIEDVLYEFQLRNAKLLLKKLQKNGLAMLADSVGLGKTITAGAVVRHYLEEFGSKRVYVIAPASLAFQWKQDLAKVHGLFHGFEVISMQDLGRIKAERAIDKYASVDLFVIDEAHNLRSGGGSRHDELLDWFSENPDSHVLLLTATPINNSLTDFVNQIQLAAKGKLESFPVVYPTSKKTEVIDFFEAVKRLTKDINTAEREDKKPDFDKVNRVMRQGLRHFLVRTTRSGIEREFGGITLPNGEVRKFPESKVIPTPYEFSPGLLDELIRITKANSSVFGEIIPERLSLTWLLELTQRAQHPLDTVTAESYRSEGVSETAFERIFQVLLLLGFAPYKTEIYKHKFYNKSPEEFKTFRLKPEESFKVNSQLSVHNMLRVTLLKRLESSQFALKKSLINYLNRLEEFESILLKQNVISSVKDIRNLKAQFGDDLELLDLESDGVAVEHVVADPKVFNLESLKADLDRDRLLIKVLIEMCETLGKHDDKLSNFSSLLEHLRTVQPAGKKVLVFSYYSDTIEYLQSSLGNYYKKESIPSVAAFTSGKTKGQIETLAKRFSPNSKGGAEDVADQGEIDILFATDVLSEGQNLQDCGILINFDLHWNPVRMIQRNGRINRLGSKHQEVFIYNIHPDVDLDEYLALVNRLERKIDRIRYTVGTDQSVLGEDANPIEYVDDLDEAISESQVTLALYSANNAEATLQKLDDDQSLLSEDEFILDLREFERSATPGERALISKIPTGKWGRITQEGSSKLDSSIALSLVKVVGTVAGMEQNFENHIFVSTTDSVGAVETMDALSALRVPKTDKNFEPDNINLQRGKIAQRAIQVARAHARNTPTFFRLTPSVTKILDAFKAQAPQAELHDAFRKITTKQESKRARALVERGNRDIKGSGILASETVAELADFSMQMSKKILPQKEISSTGVVGVLHFGR